MPPFLEAKQITLIYRLTKNTDLFTTKKKKRHEDFLATVLSHRELFFSHRGHIRLAA
jgi:hypothetical protein